MPSWAHSNVLSSKMIYHKLFAYFAYFWGKPKKCLLGKADLDEIVYTYIAISECSTPFIQERIDVQCGKINFKAGNIISSVYQ